MEQVKCGGCDNPLMAGDQFCGICGTSATAVTNAAPRPGRTGPENGVRDGWRDTWRAPAGEAAQPAGQAPFFEHELGHRPGPLNNATRYLCAAGYLDSGFANEVIRKLVASRRAVAPSVSFDVGPVIRHCLRARRNRLIRNIALAVAVLFGLILAPLTTIDFLLVTFLFGVLLPNVKWRRRGFIGKFLIAWAIVINVWVVAGFTFSIMVGSFVSAFTQGSGSLSSAVTNELGIVEALGGLFVVALAVQFVFAHITFRTLYQHLRPGARPPEAGSGATEARIGVVEGAQRGNITFYAGENPFIGAGAPLGNHWSIAIKLDPKDQARQGLLARSAADRYVAIDPVELHASIRERLLMLNDPGLPVNERIAALKVTDRLVGPGLVRWTSPLVDARLKTPYSHASPPAIEALIRHPQAGVRYYQQVSVADEGPPVTSGGRQVIEGADHGVAVSAFVYAAVEGRMFYLEFTLTALPPVKRDYATIELLPGKSPGAFFVMTLGYSIKTLFKSIAYLPFEIYGAFRAWWAERRDERRALAADGSAAGDFGTLISVREMGAEEELTSYIHLLDAEKYQKIIERMLLETVQDFLAAKGVDISAFEGSAHSVINGDVIQTGPVSGSGFNIGGHGHTINQQAAPSAS